MLTRAFATKPDFAAKFAEDSDSVANAIIGRTVAPCVFADRVRVESRKTLRSGEPSNAAKLLPFANGSLETGAVSLRSGGARSNDGSPAPA